MKYEDIPWAFGGCVGTDPEVWFPEGTNANRENTTVEQVCRRCEIKAECLAWAEENHEFGWWGGRYFSNRDGMRSESDEHTSEVHSGGNGGDVPDVWQGTDSAVLPDLRDADG